MINLDDFIDNLETYFKNLDINIAELEKLGASLLSIGYMQFYYGADLDIYEAEEILSPDLLSPDYVTLFGEFLVLIGYVILFIVSNNRVNEKIQLNNFQNEDKLISAQILVSNSYLLSIFANFLRLIGFYYIYIDETN